MAKPQSKLVDTFANLLIVTILSTLSSAAIFGMFLASAGMYANLTNLSPPIGLIGLGSTVIVIVSIILFPLIWKIYVRK